MDINKLYSDNSIIEAIRNSAGPSIINAGPGSGKTRFLCAKVAYLLCDEKVNPASIIICTFTEKAAEELKSRIKSLIIREDPAFYNSIDFDKLRIGTIHSIFQSIIEQNIIFTGYKSGINVLDELDRKLFIHNHLKEFGFDTYTIPSTKGGDKLFYDFDDTVDIFYEEVDEWTITDFLCDFYDDLVDQGVEITGFSKLIQRYRSQDSFLKIIDSYNKYKQLLAQNNYLDFSQIQNVYWQMLQIEDFRRLIRNEIKYVLVDEYQDTNYIQERALLETIGDINSGDIGLINFENGEKYPLRNYTVVGDINQSLYRFRGADIDNILTFNTKFISKIREYKLFSNYRSTENIINLCNEFIRKNLDFYNKRIGINPKDFIIKTGTDKENYPILSFVSSNRKTEDFVLSIRSFVHNLIDQKKIKNRSDVAILLPSIRYTEAKAFVSIFGDEIKIPAHLEFFDNPLTKAILNAFSRISGIITVNKFISEEYNIYFDSEIKKSSVATDRELAEISENLSGETDLLSFLYQILGLPSFIKLNEPKNFRCIGLFSEQIAKYSHLFPNANLGEFIKEYLPVIYKNAEEIFQETESVELDKISLMTIHQSKGLQFPIVIVGYNKSINSRTDVPKYKNTRLIVADATNRHQIETEDVAEELELRRLFYVAFSRAKDLLVIGTRNSSKAEELKPHIFHYSICSSGHSDCVPERFTYQQEDNKEQKPAFSFTGDIETYNLCPRLYEYINEYGLVVPDKDDFSFGKLVHQTIENINKNVLLRKTDMTSTEIYENAVQEFEKVFISMPDSEKLSDQKPYAFRQVKNYLDYFIPLLNKDNLYSVEESVSIETEAYELKGRIDAVFKLQDKFIIVDIKSGKKSNKSEREITNFESQIKLYGSYYSRKYNIPVSLLIYSAGEKDYRDGEYVVSPDGVAKVFDNVDDTIRKILCKVYDIAPGVYNLTEVCPNCPFSHFCKYKV